MSDFKLDGTGRLHGRVAIVTGSSSGMGRGIALRLAREGAIVMCTDLRPEANPQGFEEDRHIPTHQVILDNKGQAAFTKCDMSKTKEIENLFEVTIKQYNRLDILVNCAGMWLPLRDFVDETEEIFDAMFAINTKGPSTAMRLAIKQFMTQSPVGTTSSRGRIVNISSSAGIVAVGREATYAASKAALSMFTRAIALDHAKDGINVNAVCPGVVRTGLSSTNFRDQGIIAAMRKSTPFPRLGEPIDVAHMVAFLCMDETEWVTGQNIAVDGGFTVGIPL